MNKKLLALASAIAASALLAPVAEAGSGVRLGFGGPLGTFVATPSNGGGGSSSNHHAMPQKRVPSQQVSRPEKSTPRVVRSEASKTAAPDVASKVESTPSANNSATGSSALIQGSIPADEPTSAKVTPAFETKAEAASTSNASNSITVTATAPAESVPQTTSAAPEACKRYIPAIGTTISVGCND